MTGKRPITAIDLTDEADVPFSSNKRQRHGTDGQAISHTGTSTQNDETSLTGATEELPSSGDFNDDAYQNLQLYGALPTKVVGVRFYKGWATSGEVVIVRRQPDNPYDGNAIQILNVMGQQIGHVPRGPASKLAPFIDDQSLIIEGVLTGPKGAYDAPMSLKMYGTSSSTGQESLKARLQESRLPISGIVQEERDRARREKQAAKRQQQEQRQALKEARGRANVVSQTKGQQWAADTAHDFANLNTHTEEPDGNQEPSMEDIMESTVQFNPRELSEVVDKYGAGEDVLSKLPMAEQPPALMTKLLPYQRQGLAWMLDRETPEYPKAGSHESTQLWKRNANGTFTNIATNYTQREPKLASGGLLADDMGLGKTIQVISLLLADPGRARTAPTLIVAPLSVMSNWTQQAAAHVHPEHPLKFLVYHGSGQTNLSEAQLCEHDIVVTTYQTLAQEYMPRGAKSVEQVPRKTGLFSFEWRRVVLDEGHHCRNPAAKMTRAAHALLARSRWILTGTPIVNNLRDLQSHVKFLRLTGGLEQPDVFSSTVIRPLKQGRPEATLLLQALMSTLCLRRMKDMKFVNLRLPELSSLKYTVQFLPYEKERYDAFAQEAKGILIDYQTRKTGKGENAYSHLLEVLLRLRQTCNHWKLCGNRVTNLMTILEQQQKVKLTPENIASLQDLLQLSIDSHEECAICLEPLHNPTITACAHVFGGDCIERVIETQHKCPMCRAEMEDNGSLVHPRIELAESAIPDDIDVATSSSKTEALLDILKASRKKDTSTKTVVFSQWTSYLNVIQQQLNTHGFNFCRLDGTMKAGERDRALDKLAKDPECTVMLASLGVCSVGLNLVAANQVILSDSWWAPAIEDQAVDRVHRLGQTRPTTVFRLVMEDSIEERVLGIQEEKRKLMMMAFQEKTMKRGKEKSSRFADIERLLA
ncbi:MAG: hypothetical protein M1828_004614 [Chrysothrix sp. TS-e1954]|nr:MAG: hypothetical protein M1828_004614 [Chrysothrix sp. TS-e1954]